MSSPWTPLLVLLWKVQKQHCDKIKQCKCKDTIVQLLLLKVHCGENKQIFESWNIFFSSESKKFGFKSFYQFQEYSWKASSPYHVTNHYGRFSFHVKSIKEGW